jgi:hypothetical protein
MAAVRVEILLFVVGSVWSVTGCAGGDSPPPTTTKAPDEEADSGIANDVDPTDDSPLGPALSVASPTVHLGTFDPRCPSSVVVPLENRGETTATNLTATATAGWMVSLAQDTLAPGESTELVVEWAADTSEPVGTITVSADHLDAPLPIPVGFTPTNPSDSLDIDLGDRSTADLLLAVDRSCNIDDMARLEPAWPALRRALSDHGISLRMASVVTADGCILGEPLVADGRLDDDEFRAVLWAQQDWTSELDATTERLLEKSVLALEQKNTEDCNAGLHNPAHPLHVLLFSDEPDQSPLPWSDYLPQLADHTDPGLPMVVHGIGDSATSGCPTASPYWGAIEAVDATGGAWLTWCTEDWDTALTGLAETMAEVHQRVSLDAMVASDLDPATITAVSVDGEALEGWTWDPERRDLSLAAMPLSAETLTLQVTPPPDCPE